MKFLFLLFFVVLPSLSFAEPKCELSETQWKKYLSMDWKSFDQTLGKGWREFAANDCEIAAGHLIDVYSSHNSNKLNEMQKRVLRWHAGQQYAQGNIKTLALVRFRYSFKKDEDPNDPFKWNAYVAASIAFLEKDLKKLKAARDEMLPFAEQNIQNLIIVNNMYKCPHLSYKQVINGLPLTTCE